jgi:hypothetical protein
MKDWIALLVSGAMTGFGTVAAAAGCSVGGLFYGVCVLLMLGALWYSNMCLEESLC